MAINDGYLPENILPIAEKESGRKLKEEERKGLNIMKKYIDEYNNIDCVYLWEISRLARKQKVLISIKDYLIEKNINIKIKNPSCVLLNNDGTINEMGDMVFSLFGQMSESEMRTKIARFKRTKKVNSEKGKYSGGKVMYGYTIDESGYYIINEDEAKVIRLIFDLYTNEKNNIGTIKILRELHQRGYFLKGFLINKILSNTAYIGYFDYPQGNYRKYPPIITQEIFDKAQEKKKHNSNNADKSKSIWLCSKLIKCEKCGSYMMANKGARVYSCKAHTHQNFYKKNCDNKTAINISAMDGIAWNFSKSLFFADSITDKEKQIETNQAQIEILKQKINVGKQTEYRIDEKEKRIMDSYFNLEIDEKEKIKRLKLVNIERKEHEIKIVEWNNDIQRLENEIKILEGDKKNITQIQEIKNILKLTNQRINKEEKYNIVHRYIKEIQIKEIILYFHTNKDGETNIYQEKITQKDKVKKAKEITISAYNGQIIRYFFLYNEKNGFNQFAKESEITNKITPIVIEKQ